ncbi:MAG: hypothetical protein IPI57_07285 [Candidatus Competibacteraceae bacterium]|nr:hypothetical protein [Candidatus Competibacteraceae bacterium]
MSGIELIKEIRADPVLARLSWWSVLSSILGSPDREQMQALGIRACLPKPLRKAQLHQCLLAATGKEPQSRLEKQSPPVAAISPA